jgi:hypothetical protein
LQIPAGYRIALVIGGTDFSWPAEAGQAAPVRMVHDDPRDRPPLIFGGKVTLQAGEQWPSYLALPAIPGDEFRLVIQREITAFLAALTSSSQAHTSQRQ